MQGNLFGMDAETVGATLCGTLVGPADEPVGSHDTDDDDAVLEFPR